MKSDAKPFARPLRLMTGPYLARNPLVVSAMAMGDLAGLAVARRGGTAPQDRPLNIVVSNLAHLGDVIVTLPLLAQLRALSRTAKLGLVIGDWSRSLLDLGHLADSVHVVDHWRLNRSSQGLAAKLRRHWKTRRAALAEMRRENYDVAIDAYAYFGNSSGLFWSAGVPVRIGFTSGGASSFYTHRFAFDPLASIPANQARLLAPLMEAASGEQPGGRALFAAPPPGFRPDADVECLAASFGDFIVLHIGPGNLQRDWPAAEWLALGRRLIANGFRLVFTGAASEAAHGAEVRAKLGGEDLMGRLSLRGFATLLSLARGLVAIDTMAGHLAACFQTPTAVVFTGIAPPNRWRPNQPFARVATFPVPCAPCNRTHGCAAMACIRSLSAKVVYEALNDAMQAKAAALA